MIQVIKVTTEHMQDIVPLFDQYRVFYKQVSDPTSAERFLLDRIKKEESVIFLAVYKGTPAGFTQLYSTFSSVSLQPVYILNDLFVSQKFRKKGIGEALLNRAKKLCVTNNYKGLALETDTGNPAQHLYEKLGWEKDAHCFHYFWTSKPSV